MHLFSYEIKKRDARSKFKKSKFDDSNNLFLIFFIFQLKRYKAYSAVLKPKLEGGGDEQNNYFTFLQKGDEISKINSINTTSAGASMNQLSPTQEHQPASNRYSYRAAIYRNEAQQDLG